MIFYNIFLDDTRTPPDAFQYIFNEEYVTLDWVLADSYVEFVRVVSDNYDIGNIPKNISFDHDLHDEHYKYTQGDIPYNKFKYKTGYDCALWLVEFCIDNEVPLPNYFIHSLNMVGTYNIRMLLDNYKKYEQSKFKKAIK